MIGISNVSEAPATFDGVNLRLLRLDYSSAVDGTRDWAIIHPSRSKTWVVMIHGHGSHGDQLFVNQEIKKTWLPNIVARGFGILCPNLRDNAWMSPVAGADMHALLDYAREKHGADTFIFASGSMGGTSNLIYSVLHPEDVNAVLALCPATDLPSYHEWLGTSPLPVCAEIKAAIESSYGGPPHRHPEVYARHSALAQCDRLTMPLYIAHGTSDDIIPLSQARALAEKLSGAPNLRYVEVPNGDHGATHPLFGEALEHLCSTASVRN